MPEGAALSWSFSAVVIRRKGRLAFGYRVPGARYSINGRNRRIVAIRTHELNGGIASDSGHRRSGGDRLNRVPV
jgi:hypothetical protein